METTSTNTKALMAQKAMKMAHLLFHLLKKALSTTNLLLPVLLHRCNKLASKALHSLLHHHPPPSFLCGARNDAVHSSNFPALKEYEFSCSNSPAFHLIPLVSRKAKLLRRRHHHHHRYTVEQAAVAAAVQRVFDMLNSEANSAPAEGAGSAAATPMLLPGFGKSPAVPVRQLRVTDSPFPLKENEEEAKLVSKAADDFIRRFYRDLKREKSLASPFRHS